MRVDEAAGPHVAPVGPGEEERRAGPGQRRHRQPADGEFVVDKKHHRPGRNQPVHRGVKLKGAKVGDKIKVAWSDNKGESGSGEATIGQ